MTFPGVVAFWLNFAWFQYSVFFVDYSFQNKIIHLKTFHFNNNTVTFQKVLFYETTVIDQQPLEQFKHNVYDAALFHQNDACHLW